MKTSPRIHKGPIWGGKSKPMKPLKQIWAPAVPSCNIYCCGVSVNVCPPILNAMFGNELIFEQSTTDSPFGLGNKSHNSSNTTLMNAYIYYY